MSTSAKKLPSGNWRCRAFYYDDAGKRKCVSFTAEKKTEAEYQAKEFLQDHRHKQSPLNMTVGSAIDAYIDNRSAILSPSTIKAYRSLRNFAFNKIIDMRLEILTKERVQESMNDYAKMHSPKSARNALALLSSSVSANTDRINFSKIMLPAKKKAHILIPTTQEVDEIILAASGTDLYLPVLFGALLGMRRSEIAALNRSSFDEATEFVRIDKALVKDEFNTYVLKSPKTESSNRVLRLPKVIVDALLVCDTPVIKLSPQQISVHFMRLVKRIGLPNYTFHSLRHYNASVMLQLNIPDKYAMERTGHATNNMLKTVYQHTFSNEQMLIADRLDEFYSANLLNTKTSGE